MFSRDRYFDNLAAKLDNLHPPRHAQYIANQISIWKSRHARLDTIHNPPCNALEIESIILELERMQADARAYA
jgi:hypothetical protein